MSLLRLLSVNMRPQVATTLRGIHLSISIAQALSYTASLPSEDQWLFHWSKMKFWSGCEYELVYKQLEQRPGQDSSLLCTVNRLEHETNNYARLRRVTLFIAFMDLKLHR